MSENANPISDPREWDTFFLDGVESPGLCKIDEGKIQYKWDEKAGPGTTGDTVTFRGAKVAHFPVTLRFWIQEQVDAWDVFQKTLLEIKAGKKPLKSATIRYPGLARLGITSVTTENIGMLKHEGAQLWSVSFDLIQYKPPPKVKVTATPVKVPEETDPEIEKLKKELKKQQETPPTGLF